MCVHVYTLSTDGSFAAGANITLASGEEVVIEKQTVGVEVISFAGDITTISEFTENDGSGVGLFGINDDIPFATFNQPFWTGDGWKCIYPDTAGPDTNYGELQIGDIVLRIATLDPLLYEPIKIRYLNYISLSEPDKTYTLHLDGPLSCHANGYVVATNYAAITKKRAQDEL